MSAYPTEKLGPKTSGQKNYYGGGVARIYYACSTYEAETQSVFVLAATNRIDQIDSAVISRFAKKIEIPVPDSEARQKLLTVLLGSKPIAFDLNQIAGHLAEHGEGMSGRDIRNWIDQAEHNAVGRAIEAGDLENASIILDDFPSLQTA